MSYAIASELTFSDRRLSGADLRVLLAILSHTRPGKPYCWPSRARIAERIGIKSHSRVSEILARLVAYGWLTIKRTGRSNLYFVHTPNTTSDVHPVVDMEDRSEYLEERPPYPPAVSVAWTENQDDNLPAVGVIEQPECLDVDQDQGTSPETVEQSTKVEESHQGEEAETTDHREAVQVTESTEESHQGERLAESSHREAVEPSESVPAPALAPKAKRDPRERQEAIQAVLERFEQVSGIRYGGWATERKIARRVERYGLALVLAVIGAKGADFRHPLVLLKPSVLESVAAELERDQRERQQAIEADQRRLEAMRQGTGTRTREGAQRGLQALKAALGMRGKPPDDGALTA